MNNAEFNIFAKKLFTQFPSLYEWLARSSPDPEGTQVLWHATLKNCSLAECERVLHFWLESGQAPFAAYERDQVAVIIRSVVAKNRDRENRRKRIEEEAYQRNQVKRKGTCESVGGYSFGGDLGCASAFTELKPVHKAWQHGLMDAVEYKERETEILERHIDGKPKREIAGKWHGEPIKTDTNRAVAANAMSEGQQNTARNSVVDTLAMMELRGQTNER